MNFPSNVKLHLLFQQHASNSRRKFQLNKNKFPSKATKNLQQFRAAKSLIRYENISTLFLIENYGFLKNRKNASVEGHFNDVYTMKYSISAAIFRTHRNGSIQETNGINPLHCVVKR